MKVLIDGQTLASPEMRRGIGLVFARLLEEMVVPEIGIDWHIAVRDPAVLGVLPQRVGAALEPVLLPALQAAGEQVEWCRAYGRQVQEAAGAIGADWYWNPNPLMPNVHFPLGLRGVRAVYTLHDIIPRLFPAWYLDRWPAALAQDYRERLAEMAREAHTIVSDSDRSAADFRSIHPESRARFVTAHCGCDYASMFPLRCGAVAAAERYVLYLGGFDPRKNMEGAVRAFARFRSALPPGQQDVRFKVVCAHTPQEAAALGSLAEEEGVGNVVDLLGYVEDEELGGLFRSARVLFFPSYYEGFGLPVLDALACGVPVVAGDAGSVPEVCGGHALLADPGDVAALAARLREAWNQRMARPGPWLENAQHARATFDWRRAADRYLAVLGAGERAPAQAPAIARGGAPLALFSPWPPLRTGVADYSYSLARRLAARRAVTVFTDVEQPFGLPGVQFLPLQEFEADPARYPDRIYHLGNNNAHRPIYRLAWKHPGVIVVHDYNMHPFMVNNFLVSGETEMYLDALLWYGERGTAAWRAFEQEGIVPDTWDFAMTEPILSRSRGAIVHSRWARRRLRDFGRVLAGHHGAEVAPPASEAERAQAKEALGLDPDLHYVGAFGFINAHKRVDVGFRAVGALRRQGYPVCLLLVGESNDTRVDLSWLRDEHLGDAGLVHVGYASDRDYDRYLGAVDVLLNLRYPTMGESSGSLFRAFAQGVATIVSDVGPFAELPDTAAWKAEVGQAEDEVVTGYLRHLLEHPDARRALGEGGRDFARRFGSFERTAELYLRALGEG